MFLQVGTLIDKIKLKKELNDYQLTLNYIKSYKNEHRIYPSTINNHLKPTRILSHYEYKLLNKGNDFILNIRDEKKSFPNYNYCSSITISGCNDNDDSPIIRTYFNKWVKEELIED